MTNASRIAAAKHDGQVAQVRLRGGEVDDADGPDPAERDDRRGARHERQTGERGPAEGEHEREHRRGDAQREAAEVAGDGDGGGEHGRDDRPGGELHGAP